MPEVLVVFTAKKPARILDEGGTQAWKFKPQRVRRCAYVILTQNREYTGNRTTRDRSWGDATEPHGAAFMVGKISDVVPATDTTAPEGRYLVKFSEYARVEIKNFWRGDRNPVSYRSLEEIGFDPGKLDFIPMPKPGFTGHSPAMAHKAVTPLTLPAAKAALAAHLGISPDAIEITIKG